MLLRQDDEIDSPILLSAFGRFIARNRVKLRIAGPRKPFWSQPELLDQKPRNFRGSRSGQFPVRRELGRVNSYPIGVTFDADMVFSFS